MSCLVCIFLWFLHCCGPFATGIEYYVSDLMLLHILLAIWHRHTCACCGLPG